jgi:hypothetical protein
MNKILVVNQDEKPSSKIMKKIRKENLIINHKENTSRKSRRKNLVIKHKEKSSSNLRTKNSKKNL